MAEKARLPNFRALLRGHFFAGLLVVIPIAVIAWIGGAVLRALWRLQEFVPTDWKPAAFAHHPKLGMLTGVAFTLGSALALALAVSILGWASKQFLGRQVLRLIGALIQRIPVLRSIYSALDQLLRTMTSSGGNQFNRVVYVEFPRKGAWAIGFVTGPARGVGVPPGHLNVFVPTTPNPTAGFHFLVPENEVRESPMSVEQAFRTIISLGLAQPSEGAHGR